jgi:predicted ArsR family transcriptional regulator
MEVDGTVGVTLPSTEVLKALGDDSRRGIYGLLAAAAAPMSTTEVAEVTGLHPNTVRPHLERLRDAGLVQVVIESTGSVGRPQHRYQIAGSVAESPDEARVLLSRALLEAAAEAGVHGDDLADLGREQGRRDAAPARGSALDALESQQQRLGFGPELVGGPPRPTMLFGQCPFRELAERRPDLVCGLHSGLVEGLVDEIGGCSVVAFHPLVEREPCRVELMAR